MFKIIFYLFHCASAVENGFNTNFKLVAENQADMSVMALCMTYGDTRANEMGPFNKEINKQYKRSTGKSRQHYCEYLVEKGETKMCC